MCVFFFLFFFFEWPQFSGSSYQFSDNIKRKQMRQKIGILGYTYVYHSKILSFLIKAKRKTGFIFVIIDIGNRHA